MTKRNLWAVMAVAALGLGLAACGDDDDDNGGTPPATCTPPATATVRFSTDVYPVLTANCTPCHGDAGTASKYGSATSGTSYAAAAAKVTTATPAQSPLLVFGNGGSSHPGGDKLSDADSLKVQQWITECAQNN
jgi:mono/diheme cytochrome c family protein